MSTTTTSSSSLHPIRRRPRICKTCLSCRASKVRCDRNLPCGNCVKRNFTCSYSNAPQPPPPSSSVASQQQQQQSLLQQVQRPQVPVFTTDTAAATTTTPSSSVVPSVGITPDPGPNNRYSNENDDDDDDDNGSSSGDDDYADSQEESLSDNVSISQGEWDDIHSKMGAMEQILASLHSLFEAHSGRRRKPPPGSAVETSSLEQQEQQHHHHHHHQRQQSSPHEDTYRGSNPLKPSAIHIGSRSALVDIQDKSKKSDDTTSQALPKDDLLAELALGNQSVAYPFVDLWSSDPFTFNIVAVCEVLPVDEQCYRFFGFYRDIGAVLYPVLSDVVEVERNLHRLLRNRAQAGGGYRPDANGLVKPFGMSLGFLSLLFAILASGCQLSDLPTSERELTSWVYVSCSYQCLRMMNYVAQPTVEVIQILLIISNVLSYNMNAGASYTLLGMTERMCLVLGLHVESPGVPRFEQAIRRRVWWTMAFQNSHFSLAYDRPSITMVSQPEIAYDRKSMPGHRSYFESLCRVVSLALEVLRGRMDPEHSHVRYHDIREYKQRMHRILAEAAPHMRFPDHCYTLADHIERTELRLHSCYLVSVLCRVSLEPHSHLDYHRRALVREDCIANLIGTIEAFVELHSIHPHCSRSWISVQRAIASAFLLVAHDGQSHPLTWKLINNLQDVLADHVYADGAADHNSRTDSASHLASSLRALREISAAFRAQHMQMQAPDNSIIPNLNIPKVTVSMPASTSASALDSMEIDPTATATAPAAVPSMPGDDSVPGEHTDMRNILDRVSDVMLFPNMSPTGEC